MKQKEIRVLMVEPGKYPKVTTLQNDLDSLQRAVSIGADYQGLIEIVPLENGDCILCNEEGKPGILATMVYPMDFLISFWTENCVFYIKKRKYLVICEEILFESCD